MPKTSKRKHLISAKVVATTTQACVLKFIIQNLYKYKKNTTFYIKIY